MNRVYPIRTTRKKWKIPLFCTHECKEEYCNIIIEDNGESYNVRENPNYIDGKCQLHEKISSTFIRLTDFDINDPRGFFGKLYEPEMKVILDNEFTVSIDFPLSYSFEAIVITPTNTGFSLKELIFSIKHIYEFIYEEEENTASSQIYTLKKVCTSCGNKDLSEYIELLDTFLLNDDDCCICFSGYNFSPESGRKTPFSPAVKLKCNHVYHEACIKKWLEKTGTCPCCRYNVYECDACDGTGIIYYNFTGVVIPVEERSDIFVRNETNGIFGLYLYDLEDLFIESMKYNRIEKRLDLKIGA